MLFAAGTASAQATPPLTTNDPAAALPQERERQQPLQNQTAQPAPPAAEPAAPTGETAFVLQSVRFRDAATIDPVRLEATWQQYRGRPVSLADLRQIASAAEGVYAEAGYPFVAVVVPVQEVRDGAVELQVVEGRISDLTVLGLDPAARRQATAAFEPLVDRRPLSMADVERAYELAQDIPGLTLAGSLRRGSQPGGMDLVVQAQRREWRFYANLNNFYPDPVGPWGVLFGADYNGASLYGDQTSLQLYSTLDWEEQRVLRLSHTRRLNWQGTAVSASVLVADASPQGAVSVLDLATDVLAARLEVSQPLIARPTFSLNAALAFEYTDQETLLFEDIQLTRDQLRILVARLYGEWGRPDRANLRYAFEIRQGLDVLDASQPGEIELSRFDADPQATVFRAALAGELPITAKAELAWRVEGQWTDGGLAAPEEFSVGNLTIGRGYEPGSAFGDRALGLSLEGRAGPYQTTSFMTTQPYVFVDAVELWNEDPLEPNDHWVSSVGIGARFDFPQRARLDVFYAEPLDDPLDLGGSEPQPRVFVNLTIGIPEAFRGIGRLVRQGPQS